METPESNPIGYAWLTERFGVVTMPHWKESRVLTKGSKRLVEKDGRLIEYFPPLQNPGDDVFAHLEFALRKEGLHLELFRKVLVRIDPGEVAAYIRSKPTGRYARMLWWLFENFTHVPLDLPDVQTGNYVDLLDPEIYVTGPVQRAKRQRVNVNLLGSIDFSPMVRKQGLGAWDEVEMRKRCEDIVSDYPPEVFQRAVHYLYAKESKSSYEIER